MSAPIRPGDRVKVTGLRHQRGRVLEGVVVSAAASPWQKMKPRALDWDRYWARAISARMRCAPWSPWLDWFYFPWLTHEMTRRPALAGEICVGHLKAAAVSNIQ